MDLVIAALPLRTGFSARIPFYIFERNGLAWLELDVAAETDIQLAGITVPTWDVHAKTDLGDVRYFIDRRSREVVRTTFSAPDGSELRIER